MHDARFSVGFFSVATWLKIFLYFISTNEIEIIRLLSVYLLPAAEETNAWVNQQLIPVCC